MATRTAQTYTTTYVTPGGTKMTRISTRPASQDTTLQKSVGSSGRVISTGRTGATPTIASSPRVDFRKVSYGQVKAAGFSTLGEYKAAYEAGNAPAPSTVKSIQTFQSGSYNPNTMQYIDSKGQSYSTTDPAKLDAQLRSGPAVKTASLDTSRVSSAPTASVVAAVATKSVVDSDSSIQQVVMSGNEVARATRELKASGGFQDIKTPKQTGFYFGTMKTGGGLLKNIIGEDKPIAVEKSTGQKYLVVETGDTESIFADTVGLKSEQKKVISQKIYGVPFERGTGIFKGTGYEQLTKTGNVIELGTDRKVSKKEQEALLSFQTGRQATKGGQTFALGLTLGGGGKVVNLAAQGGGQVAAKAGLGGAFQTVKPYLISAGLYAGGTQAPELARQVALQTNREQLKDVDVGSQKFDKVIGSTFTETNQEYFGGTKYSVDEQGNVIKKETVKGKGGDLQKFVVGAFPGLKANPVDIYDDDFKKNLKVEYKKAYGESLSDAEVDAVTNVYLYSAGVGQAVGQVSQEVASEYAFRNLAKSTVPRLMKGTTPNTLKTGLRLGGTLALESAPFGFLEGATGEITQSSFEKREQDPMRIATAGASGAVTSSAFNFLGGGLTGRFGSKGGKITQLAGWAVDPPGEIIGDKIVDIGTKGSLNVIIPGVATTNVSTGGTTTTTSVASDSKQLKTKLGNMGVANLGLYNVSTQENAIIQNALHKDLAAQVRGKGTAVEPSTGINIAIDTDTDTQTNTGTSTDTQTNTGTTTNNTTIVNEGDTTNETRNETTSEVNVDVFNESTTTSTNVNVPIVTPAGGTGFPFFFPFAGNEQKRAKGKGKLLYYNELSSAQGFYKGIQFGGPLPFKRARTTKKKRAKK